MGERVIHHLMMAIYPPEGRNVAPIVMSMSVPEPSANHIREAMISCSHEKIGGVISTLLAQGFQRVDEIAHNPPAPPAPEGEPLIQHYKQDLIDVAEGRKVFLLNADGDPFIADAQDAADLDHGSGSDPNGSTVQPSESGSSGGPSSDGFTDDPRDAEGNPIVPETVDNPATNGSVAGEKHEGNPSGT